jgi:hypothetical protein
MQSGDHDGPVAVVPAAATSRLDDALSTATDVIDRTFIPENADASAWPHTWWTTSVAAYATTAVETMVAVSERSVGSDLDSRTVDRRDCRRAGRV